jgi:hypothetical protein
MIKSVDLGASGLWAGPGYPLVSFLPGGKKGKMRKHFAAIPCASPCDTVFSGKQNHIFIAVGILVYHVLPAGVKVNADALREAARAVDS